MSTYPISAFFGNVDRETAIIFGWEKIVEVVSKEKKLLGIKKVVFSKGLSSPSALKTWETIPKQSQQ